MAAEVTAPASRSDAVADRIRDDILCGAYRAGERLPAERAMANRLGVNRSSVREALRKLEQLGLVSTRRGGGTTVRHLHEASLEIVRHLLFAGGHLDRGCAEQLLDVHEMLVAGAARLAVERGDEDELLHARELLRRLAAPDATPAERVEIFDEIVELVTEASGNLVLRLCRNTVRPILAEDLHGLRLVLRPTRDLAQRVAAIDAALRARDPAAAEEGVRALLRDRREVIMEALGERNG